MQTIRTRLSVRRARSRKNSTKRRLTPTVIIFCFIGSCVRHAFAYFHPRSYTDTRGILHATCRRAPRRRKSFLFFRCPKKKSPVVICKFKERKSCCKKSSMRRSYAHFYQFYRSIRRSRAQLGQTGR